MPFQRLIRRPYVHAGKRRACRSGSLTDGAVVNPVQLFSNHHALVDLLSVSRGRLPNKVKEQAKALRNLIKSTVPLITIGGGVGWMRAI